MLLSSPSHQKSAIQTPVHSPSLTSTLAQQQLATLLKEAQQYEAKLGYENQIKAAFFYQVALAFCEKESSALFIALPTKRAEEKQTVDKSIAQQAPYSVTEVKVLRAYYTKQQKAIWVALTELELQYPIKALAKHSGTKPALSNLSSASSSTTVELKTSDAQWLNAEILYKRLVTNPYKLKLQAIREKAQSLLDAYRQQKRAAVVISTGTVETKAEESKVATSTTISSEPLLTMQAIHRTLTHEMKELVEQMIVECIADYSRIAGPPPCEYAVISFGSMAREEMTPYSDLEFGILIGDDKEEYKDYFRNLTKLLHLRVMNLGETTPTIMDVRLPEGISNPIPNGLSFDGAGPGGCKNPLGKKDKITGEVVFELVGTPEALARYQEEEIYEVGPLKEERFLPSSLAQVGLITGSEQLVCDYRNRVVEKLAVPAKRLSSKPLHQARALELMAFDIPRFRVKYGRQEEYDRSYSVKHDLYRLLNIVLSELAMYYGLFKAHSLWVQLQQLAETVQLFGPLSADAVQHLLKAIERTSEYRLSAYLALGEQVENAVLSENLQLELKGAIAQKVFYLPKAAMLEIYYSLVPLWYATKWFRDGNGYKAAFSEPVLKNFYANTPWVRAYCKLTLQGPAQALSELTPILTAQEKALSSPLAYEQAFTLQLAGQAYLESGVAFAEAERCFSLAQAFFRDGPSAFSEEYLRCELGLAWVQWLQGQGTSAAAHQEAAQHIVSSYFSKEHPYWADCALIGRYLLEPSGYLPGLKLPERVGNWHLPARNQHFTGRLAILKDLREQFQPSKSGMQLCFLSTLSGLGGIGKTQVALHYVHNPEYSYGMRLWFRAESEATLLADYLELAERFLLLAPGEKLKSEEIVERVKKHLETHPDWLAVYDNANSYGSIEKFLPMRGGHVLVTTRRSAESLEKELAESPPKGGLKAALLKIEKFTLEEAVDYFRKYLTLHSLDEPTEKALKALAKCLDCLPLALAQAAAYIRRCGITAEMYLKRYQDHYAMLLEKDLLPADSHSKPVAATWDISIQTILQEEAQEQKENGQRGLAIPLLQAMGYLSSDQIPVALLGRWLKANNYLKGTTEQFWRKHLRMHLDRLATYSLIQQNNQETVDEETVSIHPLVQTVIRERYKIALGATSAIKEEKSVSSKVDAYVRESAASESKKLVSILASTEHKAVQQLKVDELEKARFRHRHSKRRYRHRELAAAEQPLQEAIAIYRRYGDGYSSELCDSLLDLALLQQAQAHAAHAAAAKRLHEAAQNSLQAARDCLKKTIGLADALHSRCKTIAWYLSQPAHSVFSVKAIGSSLAEDSALVTSSPPSFDYWGLPDDNSISFVGRKSLLGSLNHHCRPEQAYQIIVLSAVLGLGGVGKTQLAIYYLYHAQHPYNLKVWFRAENADLLFADYRAFAHDFDLIPTDKATRKEIILAVQRYLERHPDWLVVYDNAGNRDEIREFLPTSGGHILVTTRRQVWRDVGMPIEVNVFNETEAVEYLRKLTGLEDQEAAMAELASTLGYLPLALGQAGAYIKRQGITVKAYIESYKQRSAELLQEQLAPNEDYQDTVATTWQINFKALQEEEREAKELPLSFAVLKALAYLDTEDVPRNFLEKWLLDQKLVKDIATAQWALDNVVRHLLDYSLVHVDADRATLSIHQLVQVVIRQEMVPLAVKPDVTFEVAGSKIAPTPAVMNPVVATLVSSISEEFLEETQIIKDENRRRLLFPHLKNLAEYLEHIDKPSEESGQALGSLFFYMGVYAQKQLSMSIEARGYFERALELERQHYGNYSWRIVSTLHNLANVFMALGNVAKAKELLEEALTGGKAHYGETHWQVASTLASLGEAHEALGATKEAKELLTRALTLEENHYGKHHWEIAYTLDALANVCRELGDEQEAENLLQRALTIKIDHYGPNHRQVAETLINLGNTYIALKQPSKAKDSFEQALAIEENIFGKDHWRLVSVLNGLGNADADLDNPQKAITWLERALIIGENYYGQDHWFIAPALANLGPIYQSLGMLDKAQEVLERALVIEEAYYGEDHWQVALTLRNLAEVYGNLGNIKIQRALLERVLEIKKGFFSANHWQIAVTLADLGCAYKALGDALIGKKMLEQALAIEEAHYGPNHYELVSTLNNLCGVYEDIKDYAKMKGVLERALTIEEKHYGKTHWQVGLILSNLAVAYHRASEDLSQPYEFAKRAQAIFKMHSNFHHPKIKEFEVFLIQILALQLSKELRRAYVKQKRFELAFINLYLAEKVVSLSSPTIAELREHYKPLRTDFDDVEFQQSLVKLHIQARNLVAAIIHQAFALSLASEQGASTKKLAELASNLACYYHCYAWQQAEKDMKESQEMFNKAASCFSLSVTHSPRKEYRTEYAHYLLKHRRAAEATCQLEEVLKKTKKAKKAKRTLPKKFLLKEATVAPQLEYHLWERATLVARLQMEVDFWYTITLDASIFARYLLITAYVEQRKLKKVKIHLELLEKEVERADEPLLFSLLGHAYQLVGNYAAAITSYQQAVSLQPHYRLARQQIKICQEAFETPAINEVEKESKLEIAPHRATPPNLDDYPGAMLSTSLRSSSTTDSKSAIAQMPHGRMGVLGSTEDRARLLTSAKTLANVY